MLSSVRFQELANLGWAGFAFFVIWASVKYLSRADKLTKDYTDRLDIKDSENKTLFKQHIEVTSKLNSTLELLGNNLQNKFDDVPTKIDLSNIETQSRNSHSITHYKLDTIISKLGDKNNEYTKP